MNHVYIINARDLMKICYLQGGIVVLCLYVCNNWFPGSILIICIQLFQFYSSKKLTYAALTAAPFQHSSEWPPCRAVALILLDIVGRIHYLCKWLLPLLKKTSLKLLNILENEALIFFHEIALGMYETC